MPNILQELHSFGLRLFPCSNASNPREKVALSLPVAKQMDPSLSWEHVFFFFLGGEQSRRHWGESVLGHKDSEEGEQSRKNQQKVTGADLQLTGWRALAFSVPPGLGANSPAGAGYLEMFVIILQILYCLGIQRLLATNGKTARKHLAQNLPPNQNYTQRKSNWYYFTECKSQGRGKGKALAGPWEWASPQSPHPSLGPGKS